MIPKRLTSPTDAVRQWGTLTRRYLEVLSRDKFNLLILFGQAPIIAFLTYLVVGAKSPRDFPYFMLALVSIWFGTSVASREIIRERAVYARERMVNLHLLPYVASKLFVLSLIVSFQCVLVYGTLKLFHYAGSITDAISGSASTTSQGFLPGWAIPQLIVMIITGIVGIAVGLLISAVVKTSEMATSLVPLILIPQILFAGLVGVPQGLSRAVGTLMPATWSFDEIKRFSTLDTLEEEGSDPDGVNKGRGLYKHIEDVNDQNIAKARRDIDSYKKTAENNSKKFEDDMKTYTEQAPYNSGLQKPTAPKMGPPPEVPAAKKIDEDLSPYVSFLHPWGNIILNPIALLVMFFVLVVATLISLRMQDIL